MDETGESHTAATAAGLSAGLKVLAVLEGVALGGTVGVTEVAGRLGLAKSTTQRILEDLASGGWVGSVVPEGGGHRRWSATRRVVALGLAAAEGDRLMDFAPSSVTSLRDETGETVHLVLHDGQSLFVALHADSAQPVRTHVEVGARSPLHATSSGIAYLAALPDDRVEQALDAGLPRYTDSTPVTREEVWEQVRLVRVRGYAVNPRGWWRPDVFAVAAAIVGPDGAPVAALTVSAPSGRFTDDTTRTLGLRVCEVADDLSSRLRLAGGSYV